MSPKLGAIITLAFAAFPLSIKKRKIKHWSSIQPISTAFRSMSNDLLAQNQDNVSEWSDMSIIVDCCFRKLARLA